MQPEQPPERGPIGGPPRAYVAPYNPPAPAPLDRGMLDALSTIRPDADLDQIVRGNHRDRADAWAKYASPIAIGFAITAVLLAVTVGAVPILSWAALLILAGIYSLTYAVLLLRYWATSPEGIAARHNIELWRYLRRDQDHRHRAERAAQGRRRGPQ